VVEENKNLKTCILVCSEDLEAINKQFRENDNRILELTTTIENLQADNIKLEEEKDKLKESLKIEIDLSNKKTTEIMLLEEDNEKLKENSDFLKEHYCKDLKCIKLYEQRDEAVEMLEKILGVAKEYISGYYDLQATGDIEKAEELIKRIKEADNGRDN
jgi:chromosome segregation ATPase